MGNLEGDTKPENDTTCFKATYHCPYNMLFTKDNFKLFNYIKEKYLKFLRCSEQIMKSILKLILENSISFIQVIYQCLEYKYKVI